jgi:hypothetical protein
MTLLKTWDCNNLGNQKNNKTCKKIDFLGVIIVKWAQKLVKQFLKTIILLQIFMWGHFNVMLIMGNCDEWIIWMFRNSFNLSHWMPCTHSLLISTQNGVGRKKKTLENFAAWAKKPSHDQLWLHKVLAYLLWKCTLGNVV